MNTVEEIEPRGLSKVELAQRVMDELRKHSWFAEVATVAIEPLLADQDISDWKVVPLDAKGREVKLLGDRKRELINIQIKLRNQFFVVTQD